MISTEVKKVTVELEAALNRRIPVIPVLVHRAEIPREGMLPQGMRGIAYRQAIAVRPDPDFHRDVERMLNLLKLQLQKA